MMKGIFKGGLVAAGLFGLCVAAFFLGGGVGPCGGSYPALSGLLVGMFAGPIAAALLVISSPVLAYRKIRDRHLAENEM